VKPDTACSAEIHSGCTDEPDSQTTPQTSPGIPITVISRKPSTSSGYSETVVSSRPSTSSGFAKNNAVNTLTNCTFGTDDTESDYIGSESDDGVPAEVSFSCEGKESEIEEQSAAESQSSSSKKIDKLWKKDPWSALQHMVGEYNLFI
jgi:hypothetical protein